MSSPDNLLNQLCKEWQTLNDSALKYWYLSLVSIQVICILLKEFSRCKSFFFHFYTIIPFKKDIAQFQKRHSLSSEMKATAMIEFLAHYINSGLMLVIFDMKIFVALFNLDWNYLIINGTHEDFNMLWYNNIGAAITLTMIFNIFTPHLSAFLLMFYAFFRRWRDRCNKF